MSERLCAEASGCLSVVIPAYNEERTLENVVRQVLLLPQLAEIVIVDDCSTDNTPAVADELARRFPQVKVAHQQRNGGKTEAVKTGFALTIGDIVLVQDADLEYDPAEIPYVIAPIISGVADVVYGSRFLVRKASRVLYFYHYLANKGLTFLSNLFTNVNMTDVETGYKAFRGEIIRNMKIESTGFGFEIEVTAKLAKLKCSIYEVPISYNGRTYEEGKKIGMKDGIAALWYILKFSSSTVQNSFHSVPRTKADLVKSSEVPNHVPNGNVSETSLNNLAGVLSAGKSPVTDVRPELVGASLKSK